MCGCVGLKPTYGRVSRYGLVAFASSLDQIGRFAKDVRDAATMLGVIGGHDPRDSTSVPQPVPDYAAALTGDIKGLKLGLPKEYMIGGLDAEVKAGRGRRGEATCTKLGAEIVEISLPHTDYAVATYYIIATAEASANLARFDGIRYGARVDGADPIELYGKTRGAGFGAEVKRRIILGTYVLSSGYYDAYYLRAQKVRTLIRNDFLKAFEKVDAIVTPTSPTAAFKIGEKVRRPVADVSEGYFHHLLQPGGHLRHQPSLRLHRKSAETARSACSCWASRSARKRSCASPTPTSRAQAGIRRSRRLAGNSGTD